jgi:hypothetical protein
VLRKWERNIYARLPPREGVCLGWRAWPHAQPGTPAVGYHQLSRGSSTYLLAERRRTCGALEPMVDADPSALRVWRYCEVDPGRCCPEGAGAGGGAEARMGLMGLIGLGC